jgi:hypothetical protein
MDVRRDCFSFARDQYIYWMCGAIVSVLHATNTSMNPPMARAKSLTLC